MICGDIMLGRWSTPHLQFHPSLNNEFISNSGAVLTSKVISLQKWISVAGEHSVPNKFKSRKVHFSDLARCISRILSIVFFLFLGPAGEESVQIQIFALLLLLLLLLPT